jgi:hypothetical protein
MFDTPKVKKNKDTYAIYPTKFASSTQKHKKVIETPNQPVEIKKISNKSMFSTSKVKRRQKFVWGLRSLQALPKTLKKLSKHQIYQSERKIFQKKYA